MKTSTVTWVLVSLMMSLLGPSFSFATEMQMLPSHVQMRPQAISPSLWRRALSLRKRVQPEAGNSGAQDETRSRPKSKGHTSPDGTSGSAGPRDEVRDPGGYDWDNASSGGSSSPYGVFSENVRARVSQFFAPLSGAEKQSLIGTMWWMTVGGVAVAVICTGAGEVLAVAGTVLVAL